MNEQELLQIIKKQHYDILYLLLTFKCERHTLGSMGIAALWSMTNEGVEDLTDHKFSIEAVDARFREISEFLEEKEKKDESSNQ